MTTRLDLTFKQTRFSADNRNKSVALAVTSGTQRRRWLNQRAPKHRYLALMQEAELYLEHCATQNADPMALLERASHCTVARYHAGR